MLKISEATAIALHSAVFLLNQENPVSAIVIAERFGFSKHHLSKVLRNLVVANIISSVKGPYGGFYITEKQGETSFMKILEVIEGQTNFNVCLFDKKSCNSEHCIMGKLLCNINSEFINYFKKTKIKDLNKIII